MPTRSMWSLELSTIEAVVHVLEIAIKQAIGHDHRVSSLALNVAYRSASKGK